MLAWKAWSGWCRAAAVALVVSGAADGTARLAAQSDPFTAAQAGAVTSSATPVLTGIGNILTFEDRWPATSTEMGSATRRSTARRRARGSG